MTCRDGKHIQFCPWKLRFAYLCIFLDETYMPAFRNPELQKLYENQFQIDVAHEFSNTLRVGEIYEEEDELDPSTYRQDYKVVQKSLATYTCMPKKVIILIMIIGAVLALLALCIAIYFMFFRYLLGHEIGMYDPIY